jgi:hypothetical protein
MDAEAQRRSELRRLTAQVLPGEVPVGMALARFWVRCGDTENADEVLARVKDVLAAVLRHELQANDGGASWSSALPSWFLAHSPPLGPAQRKQQLEQWNSLSPKEQKKLLATSKPSWPADDWAKDVLSNERSWYWWGAETVDRRTFFVDLIVTEWPFSSAELQWLLEAAGAQSVDWRKEDGLHWHHRT